MVDMDLIPRNSYSSRGHTQEKFLDSEPGVGPEYFRLWTKNKQTNKKKKADTSSMLTKVEPSLKST